MWKLANIYLCSAGTYSCSFMLLRHKFKLVHGQPLQIFKFLKFWMYGRPLAFVLRRHTAILIRAQLIPVPASSSSIMLSRSTCMQIHAFSYSETAEVFISLLIYFNNIGHICPINAQLTHFQADTTSFMLSWTSIICTHAHANAADIHPRKNHCVMLRKIAQGDKLVNSVICLHTEFSLSLVCDHR